MKLATTDVSAAERGVRGLFENARAESRNAEALALAQALNVLMDTREWYDEIVPFIRTQTATGLRLAAIGSAEEHLGLMEAAFDSYAQALVVERLVGDSDTLQIAIQGLIRVLRRTGVSA